MYELIQLTERTYYIKSPTNIGLFRLDEDRKSTHLNSSHTT